MRQLRPLPANVRPETHRETLRHAGEVLSHRPRDLVSIKIRPIYLRPGNGSVRLAGGYLGDASLAVSEYVSRFQMIAGVLIPRSTRAGLYALEDGTRIVIVQNETGAQFIGQVVDFLRHGAPFFTAMLGLSVPILELYTLRKKETSGHPSIPDGVSFEVRFTDKAATLRVMHVDGDPSRWGDEIKGTIAHLIDEVLRARTHQRQMLPVGAARPDRADACPAGHPIKGRQRRGTKIYHIPGGQFYARANPEVCFATEADAQAAGYRRSLR